MQSICEAFSQIVRRRSTIGPPGPRQLGEAGEDLAATAGWNSNPWTTLVSEPQQEQRMTSQDPGDPPRTSTKPARRRRWGMRVTDPPARSTNPGVRAWWGIGAFLVAMLVLGAIWSWTSTATGPSATQSAPSSTGQGGA